MPITRRDFLHSATVAGAAMSSGIAGAAAHPGRRSWRNVQDADTPSKKILILGGTRFLGPALVHACLARGWEVTLFNRGKTNPHLFPELEKLRGDRDPDVGEGLSALEGRSWDAVLDTSGYVPRIVRASTELLKDNVSQYVFISSISAYADPSDDNITEDDPVATLDDPTVEQITGQTYGALKALCEQAAEEIMPGRVSNVRPGLIVGPEDGTDRFTYWPIRVSQGGEILAPGSPEDPVQIIDVRDLAEFCVNCVAEDHTGVYNATGPEGTMTIGMMLHGCWAVTGGDVTFTWVPADFLEQQGIQPWGHMPVWVPPGSPFDGFGTVSNQKAVGAGLTFRPLAETAHDTIAWFRSEPEAEQQRLAPDAEYATETMPPREQRTARRAGISAAREKEVLQAWHERGAAE